MFLSFTERYFQKDRWTKIIGGLSVYQQMECFSSFNRTFLRNHLYPQLSLTESGLVTLENIVYHKNNH